MKLDYLIVYVKINSKCFKDLNVRDEIIKLLEENIQKSLLTCIWQWFLQYVTTSTSNKEKYLIIKIKNRCASKDTMKKVKRQPTERGKYLKIISNKGLESIIYKELL